MKKEIKKISLIMIIIIFCGLLSGCYDKREVDDLAYVIAIGLEKGKTNVLKMTVQIATPLESAGKGGEGKTGGGGEKPNIMTVETPALFSGLNMLNNSLSKKLFMSHTKLIVFSEELAREGLGKYLHAIVRGREFRPSTYIAVAKGSAEEYLKTINPILEASAAKYYEMFFKSGNYTGFIPGTQLNDFYFDTEAYNKNSVANLVSVSRYEKAEDFNNEFSTYKEKARPYPLEGDFLAGNIPKTGGIKSEAMGLAVFNGDRMVGELDGERNNYYMMITGKYNFSYWAIPDPRNKDNFVVLNIRQSRKPKNSVEMVGGKPVAHVELKLEADFESIQSNQNYEMEHEVFEKSASAFLKRGLLELLNKTAKEYKSDIFGFGKYMQYKFLTWNDWQNFKWLDRYKDSTFDVSVDLKVRRPGLIIRSIPEIRTEERKE